MRQPLFRVASLRLLAAQSRFPFGNAVTSMRIGGLGAIFSPLVVALDGAILSSPDATQCGSRAVYRDAALEMSF